RDLKVFLKANGVIPEKGEEKKNTGFHDVEEIRRSMNYDADSVQSDIAIIKLKPPVTYCLILQELFLGRFINLRRLLRIRQAKT
ncbi:unnamed protein product, partial [Allacma fusca]